MPCSVKMVIGTTALRGFPAHCSTEQVTCDLRHKTNTQDLHYLQIRQHVHVPIRISQMPGYVQVVGSIPRRHPSAIISALKRSQLPLARTGGHVQVSGGGFGTPIQNRCVEKAACAAIRRHFQHRGYSVRSREREKVGYDFDVRRGHEQLHVEVKGVSGTALRFPITANEIRCASRDRHFRLAVVTSARTRTPKVYLFDSEAFFTKFRLSALSFCAECTMR